MEKMRILLLLFLALMILAFHKSEDLQSRTIDPLELEVLREIIMTDTIPTIYYKTTITELNQPLSRTLFYLSDFDLCNSMVTMDSMKLSKEERDYIVDRFGTMETTNINKLIKDPKNYTLKQLKGHEWFVISLPVVFRDGKYAIYYSKGNYSGQFVLMKNMDGHWEDVCYSSVWSE